MINDSKRYCISVDRGEVLLNDYMGSDLTVAMAARMSFGKSVGEELTEKDKTLIKGLGKKGHKSPFYHPKISFLIKAPIFVLRQLMRHHVGIDWNEKSLRYVKDGIIDYYIPEPLDDHNWTMYINSVNSSICTYQDMLGYKVKPEVARMVLPVCCYSEVMMTASLYAVANLVKERTSGSAQAETREYAKAIEVIARSLFPVSMDALLE